MGVTVSVAMPVMPLSEAAMEVEPAATGGGYAGSIDGSDCWIAAVHGRLWVTFCIDPSL